MKAVTRSPHALVPHLCARNTARRHHLDCVLYILSLRAKDSQVASDHLHHTCSFILGNKHYLFKNHKGPRRLQHNNQIEIFQPWLASPSQASCPSSRTATNTATKSSTPSVSKCPKVARKRRRTTTGKETPPATLDPAQLDISRGPHARIAMITIPLPVPVIAPRGITSTTSMTATMIDGILITDLREIGREIEMAGTGGGTRSLSIDVLLGGRKRKGGVLLMIIRGGDLQDGMRDLDLRRRGMRGGGMIGTGIEMSRRGDGRGRVGV